MLSNGIAETSPAIGCERRCDAVRVFEHEPDLLRGLDPATAELLHRRVVVPRLQLPCGSWAPPAGADLEGALGLLVLDGVMSRSVSLQGRCCAELLGAGDLLRPWDLPPADDSLAGRCAWRVLEPATLAVLDERFAVVAGRWPKIIAALLARGSERSHGLAFHLAIAQIRQAETRLLMLFWHLAERWGRVTPGGVALALPLTHELLGDLVCLHRPTTSTALQRLTRAGEIARCADRGWMLLGEPPAHDAPRAQRLALAS
ncbi:MAG TPA: helix-turn-helix domain-containing protein [Solirubrobacteraceae bacterium]|nr:helix-turn-helix domain-containing protein [Solirubrobacteraceae bacterium]